MRQIPGKPEKKGSDLPLAAWKKENYMLPMTVFMRNASTYLLCCQDRILKKVMWKAGGKKY